MGNGERGQSTVEWVALLCLVALMFVGMLAVGVRVPGASLAHSIASRVLCAAAFAEHCGDEPVLIAAYGSEVGGLIRAHMPSLLFESGSRAVPVDFRRCREPACANSAADGRVRRSDADLPVTAFVHVVDCRKGAAEDSVAAGYECSGERAGNLYLQFWTFYTDSATLRGVPIVGDHGYHRDDWESVQIRIHPDGSVDQRASSHHGYNHARGVANWGSDAGIGILNDVVEALGARPDNGWGPETGVLLVSGGSHAGNVAGEQDGRRTPARNIHLVPLEEIAKTSPARFAVSPPWRKHVWRDPEAETTD
ncbi:MAG TPA: hypothetical protein VN752_06530 [Solirubrobacterales bacterium]|nr:hypothetical protein [Solirubrobacterales bacterium]